MRIMNGFALSVLYIIVLLLTPILGDESNIYENDDDLEVEKEWRSEWLHVGEKGSKEEAEEIDWETLKNYSEDEEPELRNQHGADDENASIESLDTVEGIQSISDNSNFEGQIKNAFLSNNKDSNEIPGYISQYNNDTSNNNLNNCTQSFSEKLNYTDGNFTILSNDSTSISNENILKNILDSNVLKDETVNEERPDVIKKDVSLEAATFDINEERKHFVNNINQYGNIITSANLDVKLTAPSFDTITIAVPTEQYDSVDVRSTIFSDAYVTNPKTSAIYNNKMENNKSKQGIDNGQNIATFLMQIAQNVTEENLSTSKLWNIESDILSEFSEITTATTIIDEPIPTPARQAIDEIAPIKVMTITTNPVGIPSRDTYNYETNITATAFQNNVSEDNPTIKNISSQESNSEELESNKIDIEKTLGTSYDLSSYTKTVGTINDINNTSQIAKGIIDYFKFVLSNTTNSNVSIEIETNDTDIIKNNRTWNVLEASKKLFNASEKVSGNSNKTKDNFEDTIIGIFEESVSSPESNNFTGTCCSIEIEETLTILSSQKGSESDIGKFDYVDYEEMDGKNDDYDETEEVNDLITAVNFIDNNFLSKLFWV